jgi:hypothetical protein
MCFTKRKLVKMFALFKIFNIIAFLLMSYQIIDLNINYLKYETVIDITCKIKVQKTLSFTFCINSLHEKTIQNLNHRNLSIFELMVSSIDCSFNDYNKNSSKVKCDERSAVIGSKTSFSSSLYHLFKSINK